MEMDDILPLIKNLLVLDSEGKRIAVKYYGDEWCDPGKRQKADATDCLCWSASLGTDARVPAGTLWQLRAPLRRRCTAKPIVRGPRMPKVRAGHLFMRTWQCWDLSPRPQLHMDRVIIKLRCYAVTGLWARNCRPTAQWTAALRAPKRETMYAVGRIWRSCSCKHIVLSWPALRPALLSGCVYKHPGHAVRTTDT